MQNRICQKQYNLWRSVVYPYLPVYKNSEKLGKPEEFVYQDCVKISDHYHAPVKKENSCTGVKSFCFGSASILLILWVIPKGLLGTLLK